MSRQCKNYGCRNPTRGGNSSRCEEHQAAYRERSRNYQIEATKRQQCRGVGCNATIRKIEFCDDPGSFTGLCQKCGWAEDARQREVAVKLEEFQEQARSAQKELGFYRELHSDITTHGDAMVADVLERLLRHIIEKKESS